MTQEQADALNEALQKIQEFTSRIEQLEQGVTIQRDALENISEEQTTAEMSLQALQTQQDAFEQRQTAMETNLAAHLSQVEQRLLNLNQMLASLETRVSDLATRGVISSTAEKSEIDISKLIAKPGVFDMQQENWETFKFQFTSWIGSQHAAFPQALETARLSALPINLHDLSDRDKTLSVALYAILVSLIPKALPLLRAVSDNNGLEGWRVLYAELEPKMTQQKAAA